MKLKEVNWDEINDYPDGYMITCTRKSLANLEPCIYEVYVPSFERARKVFELMKVMFHG